MPIHIEETAVTRVRDTLRTYLSAELILIDAEFADGLVTDKPGDAEIIGGTRRFDELGKNILVEVYGNGCGPDGGEQNRADAHANDRLAATSDISVRINSADRGTGDGWKLHQKNMRTAACVVRVLDKKHWDLGSSAGWAEWLQTRRTSAEDDYQVCRRVATFRVVTEELM